MFENIKSMLAAGTIGELFYVEVDYWHGLDQSYHGWQWASQKVHGRKLDVDGRLPRCRRRALVRAVRKWSKCPRLATISKGHYEYDANVVAMLKFEDGSIGKTSVLFDATIPYSFNIDLLGTEGSIRDNRFWAPKLLPGQSAGARYPPSSLTRQT